MEEKIFFFKYSVDKKVKQWYSKYRCERMWRNWQTHKTQNLAVVTSCGFKSRHPHSRKSEIDVYRFLVFFIAI